MIASPGKTRRWRLAIERSCWIAGVALLLFWAAARADSASGQQSALAAFDAARESGENAPAVDSSLWSPQRLAGYRASFAYHLESPLAVLEIPRLQLRVAVLDGTDEVRLNRGVGRIAGTARPGEGGNLGIAGHRDGFFRVLKDIELGDEVRLVTLDSSERYVVESIRLVEKKDVGVLDPTAEASLTLVTCYPFYYVGSAPQRFIVRARLADAGRPQPGALVAPEESSS